MIRENSFACWLFHPLVLAILLTCLNAGKAVVVDDTAYLLIARHIAHHPTDPYGHELFWYERPEPAMEILAPPVLPYWLALGIRIVGEEPLRLKFWLLPFAVLLAYTSRDLVRRCIRKSATWPLPLLVLGPGVLPLFNFMLDVPALALQLTAIRYTLRATDRQANWGWVALAGVCGGLAMQTKYSVLMLPIVMMLIGWRRQQLLRTFAICAGILLTFAAIEWACCHVRGQSHFLFHLTRKAQTDGATFWERLVERLDDSCGLANPLLAHLGVTAAPVALLALVFAKVPRRGVAIATLVATIGWLVVLFLSGQYAVIVPGPHPARDRTSIATIVFITLGSLATLAGLWAAIVGVFRRCGVRRRGALAEILLGWLLIEVLAYFVLSPFPAARRVIGVSWIGALIVYRLADRIAPIWCRGCAVTIGLAISLVVMAIDCLDAAVEPWVARRAVAIAREHATGRGYGVGHWGFQYTLDREGVSLIVPGETILHRDDWLILPMYPDEVGFYRPYHGGANIVLDTTAVQWLGEVQWDDALAAQTVPNLYGGKVPIVARKQPRLRVSVYRILRDWQPVANN